MTFQKAVVFNYFAAASLVLGPILALPWYLDILGPSEFGLLAFILMAQTFLNLFDTGISQSLVHEIVTRQKTIKNKNLKIANLLYGFEKIYWIFSIVIGTIICLSVDLFSKYWLNSEGIDQTTIDTAIYGMGLIFMFQFPGLVYRSFFIGT